MMAGRLPFGIFGQGTDELIAGLEVTIKRDSDGAVVARTHNPGSGEEQIEDNNDGTYYVDNLPTGDYSVFVGSDLVPQDELSGIPHVLASDVTGHISDATKHRTINDTGSASTDLWSAQKIVQQLSGKADTGHSHAGVYSPVSHNHDSTYLGKTLAFATTPLAEGQDVIDFLIQTANFSLDNADGYRLKLIQSFTDESILTNNASLCNNMEALQSAILNRVTDILQINPRASHLDAVQANEGKVYYIKNILATSPKSYGVYMIMAHPDGGYGQVEIAKLSETPQ
jgi:hypothetical protein